MHTTTTGSREHDPWIDRLSEYVDGDLRRNEREALERHVADCAACAVTLAELRAVVERARSLDDRPPARDLWPAIEAKIAPASHGVPGRGQVIAVPASRWWQRRLDLTVPQLAAAALVLAALSAGAMWLVLARSPLRAPVAGSSAPVASLTPDTATSEPGTTSPSVVQPEYVGPSQTASPDPLTGSAPAAVATYGVDSPRFDQAVAELEQSLADGRGRLSPRTLHILEENLRTIDRAIDEARRAVAADPANAWLRAHLAATMKRKVDLLRTATMLTAAQG
jgi:hypothetical protein